MSLLFDNNNNDNRERLWWNRGCSFSHAGHAFLGLPFSQNIFCKYKNVLEALRLDLALFRKQSLYKVNLIDQVAF